MLTGGGRRRVNINKNEIIPIILVHPSTPFLSSIISFNNKPYNRYNVDSNMIDFIAESDKFYVLWSEERRMCLRLPNVDHHNWNKSARIFIFIPLRLQIMSRKGTIEIWRRNYDAAIWCLNCVKININLHLQT